MLEAIVQALKGNKKVHDWQIRKVRTVQHELYLIGESVESERSVLAETAAVILYHDQDGKRGSSTLTFAPGELGDCAARVDRAVYMASLAGNPPHALPGPFVQPDVRVRDAALAERPGETIEGWRGALLSTVKSEPKVRLSAAEFFVYDDQIEFLNSQGAAYSYPATRAFMEFVLVSGDEGIESENYHSLRVRSAADVDMAAVAGERAAFARDMLRVSMPETQTGPVVISGDSLGNLFDPFFSRSDARSLYRGIFKTKVGDNLLSHDIKGDGLDLAIDRTIPFGTLSAPSDEEGLPAQRVEILEGGRVRSIMANKRFADYLGIQATGTSGNIVVGAGTASEARLLQGPVIQLVSFADLRANPVTGDFVSEIRLGYEIGADGTKRPLKGGSVAGNVLDAFCDCRMSREMMKSGDYHGPKSIRFNKLVISGE